jgi:hypothetical protein
LRQVEATKTVQNCEMVTGDWISLFNNAFDRAGKKIGEYHDGVSGLRYLLEVQFEGRPEPTGPVY